MDHERVNCQVSSISCGVMGLSRYDSDVEAVCYAIGARLYHPSRGDPVAFLIWSDLPDGVGSKLASFIKTKFLGDVVVSSPADNTKTGNWIQVWTCSVNHKRWKEWWSILRVAKLKKVGT